MGAPATYQRCLAKTERDPASDFRPSAVTKTIGGGRAVRGPQPIYGAVASLSAGRIRSLVQVRGPLLVSAGTRKPGRGQSWHGLSSWWRWRARGSGSAAAGCILAPVPPNIGNIRSFYAVPLRRWGAATCSSNHSYVSVSPSRSPTLGLKPSTLRARSVDEKFLRISPAGCPTR
jgi:hypothetical protein